MTSKCSYLGKAIRADLVRAFIFTVVSIGFVCIVVREGECVRRGKNRAIAEASQNRKKLCGKRNLIGSHWLLTYATKLQAVCAVLMGFFKLTVLFLFFPSVSYSLRHFCCFGLASPLTRPEKTSNAFNFNHQSLIPYRSIIN